MHQEVSALQMALRTTRSRASSGFGVRGKNLGIYHGLRLATYRTSILLLVHTKFTYPTSAGLLCLACGIFGS